MFSGIRKLYTEVGQRVGAFRLAPSKAQTQLMLFALGLVLIAGGTVHGANAQGTVDLPDVGAFNDDRIAGALTRLLTFLEGSFGALVMVGAGIGAILSSAFGQYRAALGCLIVAVGAFILRSMMTTFFNTESLDNA